MTKLNVCISANANINNTAHICLLQLRAERLPTAVLCCRDPENSRLGGSLPSAQHMKHKTQKTQKTHRESQKTHRKLVEQPCSAVRTQKTEHWEDVSFHLIHLAIATIFLTQAGVFSPAIRVLLNFDFLALALSNQ